MKIFREIVSIIAGAFCAIILPTLLLGIITYWIEQSYGLNSMQSYLWFALIWWLSLNFIKN